MINIFSGKTNNILIVGFIIYLSAVLIVPSNPLDNLPGQDNGVFLYAGQQILQGDIPYLDFWDHKGPLIFYLNAIGLGLASGSRWGVWILELIFLFLTAIGIYQIVLSKWSKFIAIMSLILWFILINKVSSYLRFGDSNYTETYSILFSVWAILFYLWSQQGKNIFLFCFLVGVCAGMSFALRPNNISIYVSIVFIELVSYAFWDNPFGIKRIIYICIVCLIVLTFVYIFFWINNAETDLFDAVFTYNLIYSQKNGDLENRFLVFWQGVKNLYWLPIIIPIGTIGQLIYFYFKRNFYKYQFTIFLLFSFVIEAILSSLSGRALLHYYISWVPVMVLLTINLFMSFVNSKWETKLTSQSILKASSLAIILLFFFFTSSSIFTYVRIFNEIKHTQNFERESALIEFIKNTTKPENKVLVWGNDVWINFLSKRESPSKYTYQYSLFLPKYTNLQKVETFLNDIKTCPPIYIIEPVVNTDEISPFKIERRFPNLPDGVQVVFEYFEENYSYLREFNEVIIYKWNGKQNLICKK